MGKDGQATLLKTRVSQTRMFSPGEIFSVSEDHFLFHPTFSIHVGLPLLCSVPFILTNRGHGFGNLAARRSFAIRASDSLNLGQFSCL